MSKEILSTNGEKLGEITLNEQVFGYWQSTWKNFFPLMLKIGIF